MGTTRRSFAENLVRAPELAILWLQPLEPLLFLRRYPRALPVVARRLQLSAVDEAAARDVLTGGNQREAASSMIARIVASTSCATWASCGVLNIASRVVGFRVASMVLPPSS